MTKKESISQLLKSKHIAIAGVSSDHKKYSRMIYEAFLDKGYKTSAVNPKLTEINGNICYHSITELPDDVDALVIIMRGDKAADILKEGIKKGTKNIWLHQGCTLKNLESFTEDKGINLINGECAFMWLEPVEGFHKFHRFIKHPFTSYNKQSRPKY